MRDGGEKLKTRREIKKGATVKQAYVNITSGTVKLNICSDQV